MVQGIDITIFGVLGILAWQDLTSRSVHWAWLALLFLLFIAQGLLCMPFSELAGQAGWNMGFVLLQWAGIIFWFSFKTRKFTHGINTLLGLGDLLFFFVICMAFSPVNFVLFFLGALLMTILGYAWYLSVAKQPNKLVPLAGTMSLALMATMVLKYIQVLPDLREDHTTLLLLNF